jgi:hypothetical protein
VPILVRPVREQLEHDRVIRLLQAKYKRKFEVGINPGNEQTVPVGTGPGAWYPDLVLQSPERGRKLLGVVEVETAESVNNLEAMSQWAAFARLRSPFHLYVPQSSIDTAKRLCADLQIPVAELWAYHLLGDQMRFTLVQRSAVPEARPRPAAAAAAPVARPRAAEPSRSAARPRTARAAAARPARRAGASGSSGRRKDAAAKPKARAAAGKRSSASSRTQKRK